MGYITVDVDVDIYDFHESMTDSEKEIMIELLSQSGDISDRDITSKRDQSVMGLEWSKMCDKLSNIRLLISADDERIIQDIIKKY